MCGLAGFLKIGTLSPDDVRRDLPEMAASLAHRGPDDEGCWHDSAAGIGLCHRRLSIIDLSPSGHQPMHSHSGRYVIAYNGEIYNFPELRRELGSRGHAFKGGSDTEVLLCAIEQWGLAATAEKILGMFAFALWDRERRELSLVRDRFGEKPLYYGLCGGCLLFGSELKALRQHSSWRGEIDRDALALLMRHDFIPAPHSIFKDIRKLPAGSLVVARVEGGRIQCAQRRYWKPETFFEDAESSSLQATPDELLESVSKAISRSVKRQMLADVPVGAFLSGGTDSSLVVATMQQATSVRVKTFSIGFSEPEFDEAPYARAVAEHLGTDHTELIVTPRECLQVVPALPEIYDEPFADPSQIPTCLVSRLARGSVTVALSGDGGDELFGGYRRYSIAASQWRAVTRLPAAIRTSGGAIVDRLTHGPLGSALQPASMLLGRRAQRAANRLHQYSLQWRAPTVRDFYRLGLHRWQASMQPVLGASPSVSLDDAEACPNVSDGLKQMMHLDTCRYLPDDILVKVDRAAMAVSLETRVPLLDLEVAEAAWRVPSSILMSDGRGKWVLRELLRRYIPNELVDRPKKGFAVPISKWLRGDLRGWAGELLDTHRLRNEGLLDASMIQRCWRQHLEARVDWGQHLWNVLMFQSWLERWHGENVSRRICARAS